MGAARRRIEAQLVFIIWPSCEETVRRLVRRKVLRKLPGLRRVLIPRTELDRYLRNGNHALLS